MSVVTGAVRVGKLLLASSLIAACNPQDLVAPPAFFDPVQALRELGLPSERPPVALASRFRDSMENMDSLASIAAFSIASCHLNATSVDRAVETLKEGVLSRYGEQKSGFLKLEYLRVFTGKVGYGTSPPCSPEKAKIASRILELS